jgi:hypothetical protein
MVAEEERAVHFTEGNVPAGVLTGGEGCDPDNSTCPDQIPTMPLRVGNP